MSIKDRIKEARQKNDLTQEQLAARIGIAKSTLAGYETGIREPNIEIIGKIMCELDIDANYLWQDECDFPMQVTYIEIEHIKKYRALDPHGKKMVDMVLEEEHVRQLAEQATTNTVKESIPKYLVLNAAHAIEGAAPEDIQHGEDIMDDENF